MPRLPLRPPQLCGAPFRGSDAVAAGLLTPTQLRGHGWQRLFHDIYVDSRTEVSHHTRCLAAMRWLLPQDAAVAGRSVVALLGVWPAPSDVEIVAPGRVRSRVGLSVHTTPLYPGDVQLRDGLPVTSVPRTCWDLSRWLPVVEAVAWSTCCWPGD